MDALRKAEDLLDDPNASQNTVDEALEALQAAGEKVKAGNLVYLTYDPSGGTFRGSTEPTVEQQPKGTAIKIPEAPTREGYTFLYWKGSEYQPGDSYDVTEHHTFTAQWQKDKPSGGNESKPESKSDPDPSGTSAGKSDTGRSVPSSGISGTDSVRRTVTSGDVKTGDDGAIGFWLLVMLANASLFATIYLRKKKGGCLATTRR